MFPPIDLELFGIHDVHSAADFIARIRKPSWDAFFIALAYKYARPSPDAECKNGCVIVDDSTHLPVGLGFNGHPRRVKGLPVRRPDKYPFILHSEDNAVTNCFRGSERATAFVTMHPCEGCIGRLANMPFVHIHRIVFAEHRDFPRAREMLAATPWITCEQYRGESPSGVLLVAAMYARVRDVYGSQLTALGSTNLYKGDPDGRRAGK